MYIYSYKHTYNKFANKFHIFIDKYIHILVEITCNPLYLRFFWELLGVCSSENKKLML